MAGDELHGIEVLAIGLPDAEHRDDVGVVQSCGRPRLATEPLEPERVEQGLGRQELEGDVPAEGFLHRLVDGPHATAADQPEDAILPDPTGVAEVRRRGAYSRWSGRR